VPLEVEPRTEPSHAAGALAVEVRAVVKRYPLFARRRDRALALLGRQAGVAHLTALGGVDLDAAPGEAVGIIGENGSGKSTLLRVVAGISTPDSGRVRVATPVAAILELGLGFHPDFTGRHNALLYGELIGVPSAQMRERLADVLAFADLGEFVDLPLRTYSSGMKARLAFAVATNVAPRVLVVDEALAVGDGAFQKKCVDRMVRFKEEGRAVLFCSHSMYLVASFCERAVWLSHGRVRAAGPAREVIHAYEEHLRHREERVAESAQPLPPRESRLAWLRSVTVEPAADAAAPGEPVAVTVTLERGQPALPLHVGVAFESSAGVVITTFFTLWDGHAALTGAGTETVTLTVPASPFARGDLDVIAYLFDASGLHLIDSVLVKRALKVSTGRWEPGLVHTPHEWTLPRAAPQPPAS
jgi:lipopolysaccharide transport system ATP-binding protein